MNRFFNRDASAQILQNIHQSAVRSVYDHAKHRMVLVDAQEKELAFFRLPITLPPPNQPLHEEAEGVHYVILLVQSGSCAMGYFEDGFNLNHKVFRAYMVRKKQGKSQIKHLKTKGKSRAGSRVRLGETVEFFENINERLQEYFQDHQVHRICMSVSKILVPYLFDSNVKTPFDKRDERIFKIPKHVHTPIYEVMLNINRFLQKGELIYEPAQEELVKELLRGVDGQEEDEEEEDFDEEALNEEEELD
ncbi:hypothetical protein [Nibribacter koreensis]|uniref:VLRF1 domain-containing protein n=1 Tax=Nibribacter koreensis TaxID=1084519 RepID=A0ABP8FG07_9BACT